MLEDILYILRVLYWVAVCILIAAFTVTYIAGHQEYPVLNKTWNQYESGKCYYYISNKDNPFENELFIRYIIDIKGNYHKYQYWLGHGFGYGSVQSESNDWLLRFNYQETPCPKQYWLF